jgi:hypothetical protein
MNADMWPEQEAVEAWWQKHRMELKAAVSEYRIKIQKEREAEDCGCKALADARKENERLKDSLKLREEREKIYWKPVLAKARGEIETLRTALEKYSGVMWTEALARLEAPRSSEKKENQNG